MFVVDLDVAAAESTKLLLRLPPRSRAWGEKVWEEKVPLVWEKDSVVPRLVVEVAADAAVNTELKDVCLVVGGTDDSVSVSITDMDQHCINASSRRVPTSFNYQA